MDFQLTRQKRNSFLIHTVLILGGICCLIPFIWMVSTSVKPLEEVFTIPIRFIPKKLQLDNFIRVFREQPLLPTYYFNSVFVTSLITISTVFFCALTGYSIAKFEYKGKNLFFLFVLATMMIPYQLLMVPYFLIAKKLGLLNSYVGLILPFALSPFGVFLMRQNMLAIPNELIEAARIDGCSEFKIFLKIAMPLSKPALSALAIFTFMLQWDNFFWPLIIVSKEKYLTLPLAIMRFQGEYQTFYNLMMAVSLIAMLPVLIVFFFAQKRFIEGMVMSGMKG
jgi:multiple sugar transport system permease protein